MINHQLLRIARFLIGCTPKRLNIIDQSTPKIYFSNHASNLDALILLAALPREMADNTHPLAARDYWGNNTVRYWMANKCLNAELISRRGEDGVKDPLVSARKLLDANKSIIIFPEGTRGRSEIPSGFKSGLYHLHRTYPQAELVPVYVQNSEKAFPKGAILPVPIACNVIFGPALQTTGLSKNEFLIKARQAVLECAGANPNA